VKKLRRYIALLALMAGTSGGLVTLLAGPASATGGPPWEPVGNPPEVGGLTFYNAAGQQITGGQISSQPLAAYVQGTSIIQSVDTKATLFGYLPVNGQAPGEWSGEALSASTTYPNASAPASIPNNSGASALPLVTGGSTDESIATLESDYPNKDTSSDGYAGIYVLRLETSAAGVASDGNYDSADIQITGSTWSVVYPVPALTSTTTSLTVSPASPQVFGTSVTLQATVSPSAAGTVQFENGTTSIGSPVTLSGGTASISTTTLPVGTDSLNAVFTPAQFSAYSGSTGTASFTVTPPPAAGTTTALAVNPSGAAADTAVTITASVTQSSTSGPLPAGSGQVSFYDDGTSTGGGVTSSSVLLGTVSLGTGGVASLSYSSFAQGVHNLVAQFTPTDSATYVTSTSSPVVFTATAPAVAPASQGVQVSIPTGALTITTPYSASSPFQLGTAVLNADATTFTASAPFGSNSSPSQGVTITDTLAGDQAWTASATVTNFVDPNGDQINGQNLSFTSVTPSYLAGNALQTGDVITTNITSAGDYAPGASGTDGLSGGPHEFATAAAGDGSVYIDGVLTLEAPTSTPAGVYTATLTFTVI
jgi:hypothetical protein